MVRGRSFESKGWSLESSQRAKRVSIRSNSSSLSTSELVTAVDAAEDDDESAICFSCKRRQRCPGADEEGQRRKEAFRGFILVAQLRFYQVLCKQCHVRLMLKQWAEIRPNYGLQNVRRPHKELWAFICPYRCVHVTTDPTKLPTNQGLHKSRIKKRGSI